MTKRKQAATWLRELIEYGFSVHDIEREGKLHASTIRSLLDSKTHDSDKVALPVLAKIRALHERYLGASPVTQLRARSEAIEARLPATAEEAYDSVKRAPSLSDLRPEEQAAVRRAFRRFELEIERAEYEKALALEQALLTLENAVASATGKKVSRNDTAKNKGGL